MADVLGLVAGSGSLPPMMAREARRAGWRVIAFALGDVASVADVADRVVPCRFGEVAPILETLAKEGVRHVVLGGRVWKDGLFHGADLDAAARVLVGRSPDWTDEALLRTATSVLEAMGIELLDQRRFLAPWLAPSGRIAGPPPDAEVDQDIERGLSVARDLAERGIGQTVVVRRGTVVAVEAGRVLLVEREAIQVEAERVGISVVGVAGRSGTG